MKLTSAQADCLEEWIWKQSADEADLLYSVGSNTALSVAAFLWGKETLVASMREHDALAPAQPCLASSLYAFILDNRFLIGPAESLDDAENGTRRALLTSIVSFATRAQAACPTLPVWRSLLSAEAEKLIADCATLYRLTYGAAWHAFQAETMRGPARLLVDQLDAER